MLIELINISRYKYSEDENVFNECQFSFRDKKSTVG